MNSRSSLPQAFTFPNYWQLLSESDRYQYACLRARMSSPTIKNQKNKRIENFTETMQIIKAFCIRGDSDDWRRCLVCGMCWLPEGFGINTHQLRLLIFKCKSSINGSLQKLGYSNSLGRTETANAIMKVFPILKDNTSEVRQWTVRRYPEPISISSPLPLVQPIISMEAPSSPVVQEKDSFIPNDTVLYSETTFEPEQFDLTPHIEAAVESQEIWDISSITDAFSFSTWQ